MKIGSLFLSLMIGAGAACSGAALAGDADKYQANISLLNHGGVNIQVTGCNAGSGDKNTCHVNGAPVTVGPDEQVNIGYAKNQEHSAQGNFVFSGVDSSDVYNLTYKFDKHVGESLLKITHVSGDSSINWVIDDSACTSSSGEGAVKCCTYDNDKHTLYSEYKYNCVLPLRAE